MTPDEMLKRSDLVFVGVIERHHFDSWPFFRVPGSETSPSEGKYWKILRRKVRVEMVIRGVEPRDWIDVYEIFWTGGTTGDWNSTTDGQRALFLVRKEDGRYHVVRDWWRSIFSVANRPRPRLPLDDSRPLWERIALMNWWLPEAKESTLIRPPNFWHADPGSALSRWRTIKLARGLLRHPSSAVRVGACRQLLFAGWGQDECFDTLSGTEKKRLQDGGCVVCSAADVAADRHRMEQRGADWYWNRYPDLETRRLMTAVSNVRMRREFCRRWTAAYPDDRDSGCPPDQPPPATYVTEQGDLPLIGPWPRSTQ